MAAKRDTRQIGKLWIFLIAGIQLLKSIFFEYGVDSAYALAMSWRHITGDGLFREMWEPHQTSSYGLDAFLWLYYKLFHTLDFSAFFLQVAGAVVLVLAVCFFYAEMCKYVNRDVLMLMCLVLLVHRPKGTLLLEFSNLQFIGSIVLLTLLVKYHKIKSTCDEVDEYRHKILYLTIAISISLCAIVLAYPTGILLYIPVLIILIGQSKWDGGVFTGCCAGLGCIYLLVVSRQIGLAKLLQNLSNIKLSDQSHANREFAIKFSWAYGVNVLFVLLMLFGLLGVKYLNGMEKTIWIYGMAISLCVFLSVNLLTNLGMETRLGYLSLGAVVSLIPISKICRKSARLRKDTAESRKLLGKDTAESRKLLGKDVIESALAEFLVVLVCCVLCITRIFFVMNGYTAESGNSTIFGMENVVRVGPAKGLAATLEVCNRTKEGFADWKSAITDQDTVLAVGTWILDPTIYLSTNAEIAAYSTIDTPTYNDKLGAYWEMYPEKEPTVIAVQSYQGERLMTGYEWLDRYIQMKYELDTIGERWSFYRRKNINVIGTSMGASMNALTNASIEEQ